MTPRFKRNADGSYEIGEPSEREGLCEILRNGVAQVVLDYRSPNDQDRICKHMIALSLELAKVDQAFSQAVKDGIADGTSRDDRSLEYDPRRTIRVIDVKNVGETVRAGDGVQQFILDEELRTIPYNGPSGEVKPATFGDMNQPSPPVVETIVDDEAAAIKAVSDLLKIYECDTWRQSGRELIRKGRECTEIFGDDGIINIGRLDLPPSILGRENGGLPQDWFFYSFPPTFEMEMSTLPLAEIEPPAHDFTEEEIEAVKAWTIFAGGAVLRAECLFGDRGIGRFPNGKEVKVISNDRVRAIARYLAEKEG